MSQSMSTAVSDTVLAQRRGAVMVLTLNRPDRLNAWNADLEDRYFDLLAEADNDPDVGAIVVTGAGRGFCAGADLGELQQADDGNAPVQSAPSRPPTFPLTVRKPMVAAVNGAAAGLGLIEALYCDVRFAAPEAKLTTAFVRRGLIAEYGVAWILPRLIGTGAALDLLLSGRVITGAEAARMGLVNRVVDPDNLVNDAVSYATELATLNSPWAMSVIKQQIADGLSTGFESAVENADRLMAESFRRPDVIEGVSSYLESRPPSFPPLGPRAD